MEMARRISPGISKSENFVGQPTPRLQDWVSNTALTKAIPKERFLMKRRIIILFSDDWPIGLNMVYYNCCSKVMIAQKGYSSRDNNPLKQIYFIWTIVLAKIVFSAIFSMFYNSLKRLLSNNKQIFCVSPLALVSKKANLLWKTAFQGK